MKIPFAVAAIALSAAAVLTGCSAETVEAPKPTPDISIPAPSTEPAVVPEDSIMVPVSERLAELTSELDALWVSDTDANREEICVLWASDSDGVVAELMSGMDAGPLGVEESDVASALTDFFDSRCNKS